MAEECQWEFIPAGLKELVRFIEGVDSKIRFLLKDLQAPGHEMTGIVRALQSQQLTMKERLQDMINTTFEMDIGDEALEGFPDSEEGIGLVKALNGFFWNEEEQIDAELNKCCEILGTAWLEEPEEESEPADDLDKAKGPAKSEESPELVIKAKVNAKSDVGQEPKIKPKGLTQIEEGQELEIKAIGAAKIEEGREPEMKPKGPARVEEGHKPAMKPKGPAKIEGGQESEIKAKVPAKSREGKKQELKSKGPAKSGEGRQPSIKPKTPAKGEEGKEPDVKSMGSSRSQESEELINPKGPADHEEGQELNIEPMGPSVSKKGQQSDMVSLRGSTEESIVGNDMNKESSVAGKNPELEAAPPGMPVNFSELIDSMQRVDGKIESLSLLRNAEANGNKMTSAVEKIKESQEEFKARLSKVTEKYFKNFNEDGNLEFIASTKGSALVLKMNLRLLIKQEQQIEAQVEEHLCWKLNQMLH